MCGKMDTVQLLLDKGTNLELKDSQGRTVIDLLAEYPADKAKEICRMIQSEDLEGEVPFYCNPIPMLTRWPGNEGATTLLPAFLLYSFTYSIREQIVMSMVILLFF